MAQTARILLGFVLGPLIGALVARAGAPRAVLGAAATVGGLLLDALRMTVVPLVSALVVTGTASARRMAQAAGEPGGSAVRRSVVTLALAAGAPV